MRDATAYALGERAPSRVAEPADDAELAATLRECDERGDAVVLFGGGTLQRAAAPPRRFDVAIDLRSLRGIVAYEPSDLTISVRAGTSLDELSKTLLAHRQFLPIDAPSPRRGTVGGALAAGWGGPRRATYGLPRDLVIGSTIALSDGTLAKAGGMVVKNVSGYDMSKLYAGSLGTLGALTILNFKTLPAPQVQRAAVAALPEGTHERAVAHVREIAIEPAMALEIGGFSEIDGRDGIDGRLVLLFEGSAAVVERATRDLRSGLGSAGVPATTIIDRGAADVLQRAIDACVAPLDGGSITYRLRGSAGDTYVRARLAAALAATHELRCESIGDLRSGDVTLRVSPSGDRTFEQAAIPFDDDLHEAFSRATLLHAPDSLWGKLDAWGKPPEGIETMRSIKARFDPRGTLAPGRFVGGI